MSTPMTTTLPSTRDLTNGVRALLDAHPTLAVYESNVGVKAAIDSRGLVLGYAVLQPGGGTTNPADAPASRSLDQLPGPTLWGFNVSCVGGNHDYLMWTVDTVRKLLEGKVLALAGMSCGPIAPPFGATSGTAYKDPDSTPPRLMLSLPFSIFAVPTI